MLPPGYNVREGDGHHCNTIKRFTIRNVYTLKLQINMSGFDLVDNKICIDLKVFHSDNIMSVLFPCRMLYISILAKVVFKWSCVVISGLVSTIC